RGEMAELVEGARLEIAYTDKNPYRGFESLSLRHFYILKQKKILPC
ncbi:MAG: hypothetical protein PWR06_2192, partial [Thermoanaerobacteraceae bacterium]|nr:hypothetical protein [Thermoanaerobacteraceae bacterium]